MKTCPKCNELLGDAVKVCIKCKYQFEATELQEHLDKKDEGRQIADEYEKLKDKINKNVLYFVLNVFLCVAVFSVIFGVHIYWGDGKFKVSPSLLAPYEYIYTPDHIYLSKYYGRAKEVNIPDTLRGRPVTQIGDKCFSGNNRIVKVKIPETVNYIWFAAFSRCTSLVEVTGGNVEYIDEDAFRKCSSLTTVDLGKHIEYIRREAFYECTQLKQFPQQKHLREIEANAFADSGLEEFEFRGNAEVGEGAFANTPWLEGKVEEN